MIKVASNRLLCTERRSCVTVNANVPYVLKKGYVAWFSKQNALYSKEEYQTKDLSILMVYGIGLS